MTMLAVSVHGRVRPFFAFGAWLVAAPFLLDGVGHLGAVASVVAGIALIGLSFPRGKRSAEHYASWDKYVI